MNPVLVFLILIGAFLLWLMCSFLYVPIGKFFSRLAEDAKREMMREDMEEKE